MRQDLQSLRPVCYSHSIVPRTSVVTDGKVKVPLGEEPSYDRGSLIVGQRPPYVGLGGFDRSCQGLGTARRGVPIISSDDLGALLQRGVQLSFPSPSFANPRGFWVGAGSAEHILCQESDQDGREESHVRPRSQTQSSSVGCGRGGEVHRSQMVAALGERRIYTHDEAILPELE